MMHSGIILTSFKQHMQMTASVFFFFPAENNFAPSPTALLVGVERIILVTKAISSLCVEVNAALWYTLHRDLDRSRTRPRMKWVVEVYLRCAPIAAEEKEKKKKKKRTFCIQFWWTITGGEGSQGIVIAELWFHLARPGTPGGARYSVLLLLSQIAE